MGHRTVECGVYEYIQLLENTPFDAPVNVSHHVLRGLNHVYGEKAVDDELLRQFTIIEERRNEV